MCVCVSYLKQSSLYGYSINGSEEMNYIECLLNVEREDGKDFVLLKSY